MDLNYCPHCGEEVAERDRYCFECGAELDGGPTGQVRSLRTVAAGAVFAVLAAIENLTVVIYAEEWLELSGFEDELSVGIMQAMGGFGLLIALGILGLCYYYYQEGYVERRFFVGLLVAGVVGILFAGALSFFVIIAIGAYGLLVTLG